MTDLLRQIDDLAEPYKTRSPLNDLAAARHGDQAAIRRLTRAKLIRQAPEGSTLMADIEGLLTVNTMPVTERARRILAVRTQAARRLLEAVVSDTLPTGSRPWIPHIPPPAPAEVQEGEKTSTNTRTLTVDGGLVLPDVVIASADMSWSILTDPSAADILTALVLADALAGVAAYIVEHLEAQGEGATSLAAAVESVEEEGWEPDLIVSSRTGLADLLERSPGATRYADCDIRFSAAATRPMVLARGGTYVGTSSHDDLRAVEPSIGGFQLASVIGCVVEAGEGAVALVEESS